MGVEAGLLYATLCARTVIMRANSQYDQVAAKSNKNTVTEGHYLSLVNGSRI